MLRRYRAGSLRTSLTAILLMVFAGGWSAARPASAGGVRGTELPQPTGRYPVGRRIFYVLDSTRTDPQAIRPDGNREFMLVTWYPAGSEGREVRSPWIPEAWADSAASDLFLLTRHAATPPSNEEVRRTVRATMSWAMDSAAIAPDGLSYPVLIFSPGNVTMPEYYSSLAEELASWGYVVIGQVTTGYARSVVLPDGRVFPRRPYSDLGQWSGDMKCILDHLPQWNRDARHPFHGRLDVLRVGIYGHSSGANAAQMLGSADERVAAIAAVDPGLPDTSWATRKPTLLLLAENQSFFSRHPAEALSVGRERAQYMRRLTHGFEFTIGGSEHMSFSDLSAIAAFRSNDESVPQLRAARTVLLEFFEEALRGRPSALLDRGAVGDSLIRRGAPRLEPGDQAGG